MLENPLVVASPNLMLHSQRRSTTTVSSRTSNDDMTLDTSGANLLFKPTPIKRTAVGDLPLKKRYHRTIADVVVYDKKITSVSDKNDGDERDVVDSTSTLTETPVDFSLPTRIRAKSICCVVDKNGDSFTTEIRRNGSYHRNNSYGGDDDKSTATLLFDHESNSAAVLNFNASLLQLSHLWRNNLLASPLINSLHFPASLITTQPTLLPAGRKNYDQTPSPEKSVDTAIVPSSKTFRHHQPPTKKCKIKNNNFIVNDIADDGGDNDDLEHVINPATGNRVRRCYKNMTTERRMEANARERTRVHTIGAAFERLRKLMPSLGADQKLSKLSILRISCSYIMLLAAMNELDYSADGQAYSVEECTEMLTETVNSEVKFKR